MYPFIIYIHGFIDGVLFHYLYAWINWRCIHSLFIFMDHLAVLISIIFIHGSLVELISICIFMDHLAVLVLIIYAYFDGYLNTYFRGFCLADILVHIIVDTSWLLWWYFALYGNILFDDVLVNINIVYMFMNNRQKN